MLHESGMGGASKYGVVPQMPLASLDGVNVLDKSHLHAAANWERYCYCKLLLNTFAEWNRRRDVAESTCWVDEVHISCERTRKICLGGPQSLSSNQR